MTSSTTNKKARPFIKWAGGKTKLIPELVRHIPATKITKYVEPFIGGGAFFFWMVENYPYLENITIADTNADLIQTWVTVRNDVDLLIKKLEILEKFYTRLSATEREEFYLSIRTTFNDRTIDVDPTERSSQFIFLNKTCFNGLWRVNKKNLFNVPIGTFKNPKICDATNLQYISQMLQEKPINIVLGDFDYTLAMHDSDTTFIYVDPPYRPVVDNSFNSYQAAKFDDSEQIRLRNTLMKLRSNWMASNSYSTENYKFFSDLYRGAYVHTVLAPRSINSDSSKRGNVEELLITNYPW